MYYSFWCPSAPRPYSVWAPTYSTELYHFGVKGMHWGVRHEDKKVGRNKPGGNRDHDTENEYIKTAKNVAALGLAAYSGNVRAAVASASNLAGLARGAIAEHNFDKRTKDLKVDPETGMKLKDPSKTWSAIEDMNAVNPGLDDWTSQGSRNNCMLCTLTFDLRRRGYDVSANSATHGYDVENDLKFWYPNATSVDNTAFDPMTYMAMGGAGGAEIMTEEEWQEYIEQNMKNLLGDGSDQRGALCVNWQEDGLPVGGHAMAYEVKDGKVTIYDCQHREIVDPNVMFRQTWSAEVVRLDNVEPDKKYIKEVTR